MKHLIRNILICAFCGCNAHISAQNVDPDSTITDSVTLDGVEVVSRPSGTKKLRGIAGNAEIITSGELLRAACCNLGESFTTNPSVDVSYNDAATGARQIKLLGLSGTYVQMLTENIPNFRGSAMPYGLGYLAGPWIQSIQVSKGASSVKNGYESITGQINVEMKKPQADQEVAANAYADFKGKVELNANANVHINKRLSTVLLLHGENAFKAHDENGDSFLDMPRVRQVAAMNRWAWMGNNYVFQAGIKYIDENRRSGQSEHHMQNAGMEPYKITIDTKRWEAFTKNAFIFDKENDGNIALILSGSHNKQNAAYGHKLYAVDQANIYSSLMFERKWNSTHGLSTGLSFNYDHYDQSLRLTHDVDATPDKSKEIESVGGAYAQYTFDYDRKLLAMCGIRYDYSSLFGSMVTPRVHIRWNVVDALSLHASSGRGYRTPHVMAENNYLLASSRKIIIDDNIRQEDAWNTGIGASSTFYPANRPLTLSAEYYYTDFRHQMLTDIDSDPHAVHFKNLDGKSFSHSVQFELNYECFDDFNFTGACRYTDVKADYGKGLVAKPLTGHWKGLASVSYAPMMGLWQFDITCSITGGGRMPEPYTLPDGQLSWERRYSTFAGLNAQITRNFRHWSIYVGGENLTGYHQKRPIICADNPWTDNFDATMVYAPIHGAIVYAGIRYTWNRY